MNNTDQIDYWNGDAGKRWVQYSDHLDAMMETIATTVIDTAKLEPGEHNLDIGCGAGILSLKAAAIANTQATGLDISEPLLALARQRAKSAGLNANFINADASTYRTEHPIDAVISRFGVMFFDDPTSAFANIRSNVRPGGRLTFSCWQSLKENEWVRAPLEVAKPFLNEPLQQPPPGAPGPGAFAEPDHVTAILENSGWADIQLTDLTTDLKMPGNTPAETAKFLIQLGPLSRAIVEQDIDLTPVQKALEEKLTTLANPDGTITMGAKIWIITATTP